MSEVRRTPQGGPSETPGESPLSPRRAFVVQFRTETAGAQAHSAGRVEHMISGHATRFHSPEELWAFFVRILATVQDSNGDDKTEGL